ncbi:hypothetical protein VTJ49DRAFT_5389 [Mycothermus thermophilus]|uniref:Uncharacterized protein n=1 Tax=Humicola insolens TaxID=85995 RepID=A0ABR3V399_HUMIN
MAETPQTAPDMEARRPTGSVGTQTDEEQAPQHEREKVIDTAERVNRTTQLVQRAPSEEAKVVHAPRYDVAPQHQDNDRGGAPAVRLDMDLDIEVNLRAKIKGELELSVLDSEQTRRRRKE